MKPAWAAFMIATMAIVIGGLSLVLCTLTARNIRDKVLVQRWPIVHAYISQAHVQAVHQPPIGRRSSWSGWCVSWDYVYDWQGSHRSGVLRDDTPSGLAPGCFADESRAGRAAERRPPGSPLPARVDPTESWTSTPYSADVEASDFLLLIPGACMAIMAIRLLLAVIRMRPMALRRTPPLGDR
jgi:hypothetical protein